MKRRLIVMVCVFFTLVAMFFIFKVIPHDLIFVFRLFISFILAFLFIFVIFLCVFLYKVEKIAKKNLPLLQEKRKVKLNLKFKKIVLVNILFNLQLHHAFECFAYLQDNMIVLEVKYDRLYQSNTFYFTSPVIFFMYFSICDKEDSCN